MVRIPNWETNQHVVCEALLFCQSIFSLNDLIEEWQTYLQDHTAPSMWYLVQLHHIILFYLITVGVVVFYILIAVVINYYDLTSKTFNFFDFKIIILFIIVIYLLLFKSPVLAEEEISYKSVIIPSIFLISSIFLCKQLHNYDVKLLEVNLLEKKNTATITEIVDRIVQKDPSLTDVFEAEQRNVFFYHLNGMKRDLLEMPPRFRSDFYALSKRNTIDNSSLSELDAMVWADFLENRKIFQVLYLLKEELQVSKINLETTKKENHFLLDIEEHFPYCIQNECKWCDWYFEEGKKTIMQLVDEAITKHNQELAHVEADSIVQLSNLVFTSTGVFSIIYLIYLLIKYKW